MFKRLSVIYLLLGFFCPLMKGIAPDQIFKYRFTNRLGEPTDGVISYSGATRTLPIDNTSLGCIGWQLTYNSEGFSVVSLNLETNTKEWKGALNFGPGNAWTTYGGTASVGALPLSGTSQGNFTGYGYYPYLSVNLATATGTGSMDVVLSCWKSINYASISGGAGTVSVVAGGNLTSTAIVTGGGSQTLKTPSSLATVDSGGNAQLTSLALGGAPTSTCNASSPAAACQDWIAGNQSTNLPTNGFQLRAPSSIATPFSITTPNSVGTSGVLLATVSSTNATLSIGPIIDSSYNTFHLVGRSNNDGTFIAPGVSTSDGSNPAAGQVFGGATSIGIFGQGMLIQKNSVSFITYIKQIPPGWNSTFSGQMQWSIEASSGFGGSYVHNYSLACMIPGTTDYSVAPTFSGAVNITTVVPNTATYTTFTDTFTPTVPGGCAAGQDIVLKILRTDNVGASTLALNLGVSLPHTIQ